MSWRPEDVKGQLRTLRVSDDSDTTTCTAGRGRSETGPRQTSERNDSPLSRVIPASEACFRPRARTTGGS
jgi:hypothetical protein